jgi:ATP-dependent helicase HrpA
MISIIKAVECGWQFRYRPRPVGDDEIIAEIKDLLPRCMTADWVRLGRRLARCLRGGEARARLPELLREVRSAAEFQLRRAEAVPAVSYPAELPISQRKDEIVAAIRANRVVVIAGETGSGKTTQIPKMCLEAGQGISGKIACTQPRRVAALSVSRRIAEELNVSWGREVGCKIRFDDHSKRESYIKMLTDGMLLAELQGDRELAEYDAVIIDEAHERSLNIDFLLGHLKGLVERRDDLKVIITSATIDTKRFSEHFNNAPVIEVSGRVYPVDVEYRPLDPEREERGDVSYVDAAAEVTEEIVYSTHSGDVLIFMPGERDIREARDRIEGRLGRDAEIVPLFGRLSSADQQRVFAVSARRKIVIATNIAETSLTIPGIRYVIDSGLARISRYSSRSRTRRLPVEPVSQSSANQRKGRAGRVEDGTCIRLYSEEDFEKRQAFTQPEIQRSNLAEVILRMKAFDLGDIENFPFVQAPSPSAIGAGYNLLRELGALDKDRALTATGEKLARLPIDPTLGRMLLQAQEEHATRELLIIAAGLSIQDPRDRPLDQKDAATAAHKRFNAASSDFLTLLRIWNAVHDEWEALPTQNQRRKFCQRNFLSYLRMREWQDLHAQLLGALKDLGDARLNESSADEDAIHRSILAGLIAHVARREEPNVYRSSGNRMVKVFPGSVLHERREGGGKKKAKQREAVSKTNQPRWIVAGEIVETSQLFARTLAGIDPQWVAKIAPHCCQMEYREPHWSAPSGRVLVDEVLLLSGMELIRRKVPFGKINPNEATAIFIRDALVEENFSSRGGEASDEESLDARYPFIAHNRAVCRKVEQWLTRVRRHDVVPPGEALQEFYGRHLENISSIHELNALLKNCPEPGFLCVAEADLVGDAGTSFDDEAFPERVTVSGQTVAVRYAYAPGEEHDGATLELPFAIAQSADAAAMEWAVPGLRGRLALEMLRSLPKSFRRELMPLPAKVAVIVEEFTPSGNSFASALGEFIQRRFGLRVPIEAWSGEDVPQHLRPRIEVIGRENKPIRAGRDLNALRQRIERKQQAKAADEEPPEWRDASAQWERFDLQDWIVGDPPERITVREHAEFPLFAWPGFERVRNAVNFRLFPTPEAARRSTPDALGRLIQLALQKDLGWLEKDLRALHGLRDLYAPLGTVEELRESAMRHAVATVVGVPRLELNEAGFRAEVEAARKRVPGLAQLLIDQIKIVLEARQQTAKALGLIGGPKRQGAKTLNDLSQLDSLVSQSASDRPFERELLSLVPARFPELVPAVYLRHLPRYLKALQIRAERARLNPGKEAERAAQLAPYEARFQSLSDAPSPSSESKAGREELRWMIEDYKVSLFAQEVGTVNKVSPKRLDALIEQLGG